MRLKNKRTLLALALVLVLVLRLAPKLLSYYCNIKGTTASPTSDRGNSWAEEERLLCSEDEQRWRRIWSGNESIG